MCSAFARRRRDNLFARDNGRTANPLLLPSSWPIRGCRLPLPLICILVGIAVLYFGERGVASIFGAEGQPASAFQAIEAFASATVHTVGSAAIVGTPQSSSQPAPIEQAAPAAATSVAASLSSSKSSTTASIVTVAPKMAQSWSDAPSPVTPALPQLSAVGANASKRSQPLRQPGRITIASSSFDWTGGSTVDDKWGTSANWAGGTLPSVGSDVDIHFKSQEKQADSTYNYGPYDDFHSIIFDSSLTQLSAPEKHIPAWDGYLRLDRQQQ